MQPQQKTWVLRFGDSETVGYEVVVKVVRAAGDTAGDAVRDGVRTDVVQR